MRDGSGEHDNPVNPRKTFSHIGNAPTEMSYLKPHAGPLVLITQLQAIQTPNNGYAHNNLPMLKME